MPDDIAAGLIEQFRSSFDQAPIGVFMAPGRVNLIGEHVDYNQGICLPIALPHATYAALAPREEDRVHVVSRQEPESWSGHIDELGPGQVEGWAAYVAGVAWALREDGLDLPGVDILVDSTVPVAAGLSSSAAVECSVAIGLCAVAGHEVDDNMRRRLVAACVRAETQVAGAPTGGLDQTVALFARRDNALLLDCRDGSTDHVGWDPAAHDLVLLVVDTRATHSHRDGGYESRRRDCEQAARTLGVESLREVDDTETALASLPDARLHRRARHVLTEMVRVGQAVEQLEREDYASLGQTFTDSHASLRDDFEVSCPELDVAVATAMQHGALGARMTGGGFGGSAIALIPSGRCEQAGEAITAAFGSRGWKDPRFLLAEPSDAAHRLR